MNKEEILEILKAHRDDIKKFGVKKIGLFGSFVRGESRETSDLDIVVEFEEGRGNMHDFIGLIEYLESLFNKPVDVLTPTGIENIRIKHIKERIQREVEYV